MKLHKSYGISISSLIVIAFVVILAIVSLVGILFGTLFAPHESTTKSPNSNLESTTCTILESSPIFITIKDNSTGKPIPNLLMNVSEIPFSCGGGTASSLGIMHTNVNGTIEFCCTGDEFLLRITFSGANYYYNVTANGAMSAECVTLSLPSMQSTTTYNPLNSTNTEYECLI